MADCPALHSRTLRLSYRIARGEQGVLTFEPYKSHLVALWRFRTPAIARQSSSSLWAEFLRYDKAGDFVGMDMTRKFIQMGMTRAKRYANYKGGRKYDKAEDGSGTRGKQKEKSAGHEGQKEKLEASEIFREVWERCKEHEGYKEKKERFLAEQKVWDKEMKGKITKDKFTGQISMDAEGGVKDEEEVKKEEEQETEVETEVEAPRTRSKRTRSSTRIKKEEDVDG